MSEKLYRHKQTNELYLFFNYYDKFCLPMYERFGISYSVLKNYKSYVDKTAIMVPWIAYGGNDLHLFRKNFKEVKDKKLFEEVLELANNFKLVMIERRKNVHS